MICSQYFDLKLRPSGDDIPNWDRLAKILRVVHIGRVQSKVQFAIDFPKWMDAGFTLGDTLRVFTSSAEDAEKLYERIETVPWLGDQVEEGRVRAVKDPKGYTALVHHSIKGGAVKASKYIDQAAMMQRRERDKAKRRAQAAHLPWLNMLSSSGQAFCLRLERIGATVDQCGEPNGYGVSRPTQIIALPVM